MKKRKHYGIYCKLGCPYLRIGTGAYCRFYRNGLVYRHVGAYMGIVPIKYYRCRKCIRDEVEFGQVWKEIINEAIRQKRIGEALETSATRIIKIICWIDGVIRRIKRLFGKKK